MKWCIIGAGGIADRRFMPALLKDKENVLVALMDRNPENAKRLGEKYGVKYYSDIAEMLEKTECDSVYIGTPVSCHYEQAMLALKYGKNVIMEKPIAMNAKEGEELLKAFKKEKKQLTIGYMMHYHNLHQKTKKFIEKGMIGKPVDVRVQFSCWYPEIAGAWRQKKALGGGGVMMDLGVHCIDLLEYVLDDEIVDIQGYSANQSFAYEVEDSAVMIFKTKKGLLGHIDVNINIPDKASESKFEIYGTEGYIICTGTLGQTESGKMTWLYSPQGDYSAIQNREVGKPKKYSAAGGDLYLKQIQDFSKKVNSGKRSYASTKLAVQVQSIVDKFYE